MVDFFAAIFEGFSPTIWYPAFAIALPVGGSIIAGRYVQAAVALLACLVAPFVVTIIALMASSSAFSGSLPIGMLPFAFLVFIMTALIFPLGCMLALWRTGRLVPLATDP